MSMTNDEFRDLTRAFLTESLSEQTQVAPADLARSENQYGRTEGGDPQSYKDFSTRLDQITSLVEDLTIDYVDSGWLANGDHATLAGDTEDVFAKVDSLAMAALGLAQNMGEI